MPKTVPTYAHDDSLCTHPTGETLSDLALLFTADELSSYVSNRIAGLADLSRDWITRAAKIFWQITLGIIS